MSVVVALQEKMLKFFGKEISQASIMHDELTLEIPAEHLHKVCLKLRDETDFQFNMLMDVCGVDYLDYGVAEWSTESTSHTGFDRGVAKQSSPERKTPRFASVYHLLSLKHNHRIRLRSFVPENMQIDSVMDIWPSANWYEREAFDLFGILYKNHTDLRRILTDYGFVGHPFRKDFPVSGHVEVRYDAKAERVVYEPVDIEPRVLVPKVIRDDNRYCDEEAALKEEKAAQAILDEKKKAEEAKKASEKKKQKDDD